MSRTLFGEIAHQIFGSAKSGKPNRNIRHNKELKKAQNYYEKVKYEAKKAAFENKRAYEDAQTKAYIKGWKK